MFSLHCLLKLGGVDSMFLFAKRDIIEWGSRSQKVTSRVVLIRFGGQEYFLKYVHNPHIYQALESNCFIAARAIIVVL